MWVEVQRKSAAIFSKIEVPLPFVGQVSEEQRLHSAVHLALRFFESNHILSVRSVTRRCEKSEGIQ
jgi:hypothetical protein